VIPAPVLEAVINGSQEFFDKMKGYGINITYMGGETADVGDVVRTIAVNGTMTARWPKSKIISNEKIKPGDVIVGLAGYGKADYEDAYNSGIASNGLTSARHDVLQKSYSEKYPESYDPALDNDVVYIGPHKMTDKAGEHEVGKLLLSPTRTFAPVLKELLVNHFDAIHGLIPEIFTR
jgi:phosphoribosylformylglycinamidine cyclo-ligase